MGLLHLGAIAKGHLLLDIEILLVLHLVKIIISILWHLPRAPEVLILVEGVHSCHALAEVRTSLNAVEVRSAHSRAHWTLKAIWPLICVIRILIWILSHHILCLGIEEVLLIHGHVLIHTHRLLRVSLGVERLGLVLL